MEANVTGNEVGFLENSCYIAALVQTGQHLKLPNEVYYCWKAQFRIIHSGIETNLTNSLTVLLA